MRPLDYIRDVDPRMKELWAWVNAVCAYDFGDPSPLAALIATEKQIPAEFADAIADIVRGNRQPNKRARAKLKIPADEYMEIAGEISACIGIIDIFRYDALVPGQHGKGAAALASRDGKETEDKVAELSDEREKLIEEAASEFGVSVETIENVLREMRRRIKQWPIV